MSAAFFWTRALYVAAAVALAFAVPARLPVRASNLVAGAIGVAAGLLVHTALARRLPRVRRDGLPLLCVVSVAAAAEEGVWRWGVVGGLAPLLGSGGALALGAVGFAAAHAAPARALFVYAALGCVFGAVLLATGRLAAPVAAHVVYDALVVLARGAPP